MVAIACRLRLFGAAQTGPPGAVSGISRWQRQVPRFPGLWKSPRAVDHHISLRRTHSSTTYGFGRTTIGETPQTKTRALLPGPWLSHRDCVSV